MIAVQEEWLAISAVVARLRAAGYGDSESTVRRMIDDGDMGEIYRTRGGYRKVRATGVDALIARRRGGAPASSS